MPFETDIRKPFDFTINANYVQYIFEEQMTDFVLTNPEFTMLCNNIEAEVWCLIIRGEPFNLPEVVYNEIQSLLTTKNRL